MQQTFTKPSTCQCGGGHRRSGHRWVVISRREPPQTSQLKCLECGWKWWSKCGYVAKLPDHTERSRSGLTDQDILDRINAGDLHAAGKLQAVFSRSHRGWSELRVFERESNGSTYRFVEICAGGKKKKISLHRLVWIYHTRELIPDDHDIDHIRGKGIEHPDAIANLRMIPSTLNRSRGKPTTPAAGELPF